MAGAHVHPNYNTNADWARAYTDLHWHVLPLAPRSKDPRAGSHGIKDATSDYSKLASIFGESPLSNVAIDPARSGLIVLDDVRNGGADVLAYVLARHGPGVLDTASVGKPS